ncbi:regulatory LuxR family protein [Ilumatobacter fluminis]|uniref:Regulatory LuxR family protein n=1 Tax=Ilumatobacter fluminis TaxID=467091 RepID=A0A4R7HZ54_9ACTN|nr:LuxR C-terminal-related transcriptional regulator [Ilumatobacter fluminis]TDT15536.1 regulatory LuxR family protein [Ilumatobacter fluminis]
MPIDPPIGPKPPIGRGWLIDQITTLVDRGGLGLLTLTGLPGVGKTTVVRGALADRPHRWIAATTLPHHLPSADDVGAGDLVVVDGVTDGEQLAAVARLVDRGVDVVATARGPLRLPRERIVRVPALPVPEPDATTETLAAEPTIELFRHVAVRSGSTADWDGTDLRAVADIARAVGGHPMAIELLAARTPAYSPTSLAEQLASDRHSAVADLLDGTDDLLGTIQWSAADLADRAVSVLTALSVFEGPVPVEALERVVDDRSDDLLEVVSSLVDAHLVDADHAADGSLYSLPPLVAEVLRHRATDVDDTRRRTARLGWATELAAEATSTSRGETGLPDPRLTAAEDDLRAALVDALDSGDADAAANLTVALAPVWLGRGVLADEVALARRTVELADGTVSEPSTAIARGWLANLLAERVVVDVELDEFIDQRAGSLALLDRVEPDVRVRLLALAVRPARALADRADVIDLARLGRSTASELGDQASVVRFEVWLGMLAHQDGDVATARQWAGTALGRARQIGDEPGMVAAAGLLRTLPPGQATDIVVPTLVDLADIARRNDDTRTLTWVVPAAASEALAAGDVGPALDLTDESLSIARRAGTWTWYTCPPFTALATMASIREQHVAAATLLGVLDAQVDGFESSLPLDLVRRVRSAIADARASADAGVVSAFTDGTMMTFDRATAFAARVVSELRREHETDHDDIATDDGADLTAREVEVLRELANGGTNKDVAAALGIRPKTVMHHAAAIYRKLHVRGRGEAVAWWFQQRP